MSHRQLRLRSVCRCFSPEGARLATVCLGPLMVAAGTAGPTFERYQGAFVWWRKAAGGPPSNVVVLSQLRLHGNRAVRSGGGVPGQGLRRVLRPVGSRFDVGACKMTRLSHTVIQTLVLGTCMAGMRLLYLRTVEFAWPDPAAVRIDWVGIYGQVLSIFVFLEGTLVILRSSLKRRPLRRSSGIIFIMLCTCYMCAYATLKAASAGLCWQFGGILRGGRPWSAARHRIRPSSNVVQRLGTARLSCNPCRLCSTAAPKYTEGGRRRGLCTAGLGRVAAHTFIDFRRCCARSVQALGAPLSAGRLRGDRLCFRRLRGDRLCFLFSGRLCGDRRRSRSARTTRPEAGSPSSPTLGRPMAPRPPTSRGSDLNKSYFG